MVEYAFLADFDLLRSTRQDVHERPWARPAGRAAMDQYFKMLCAQEEINCLNIKIPHVVTYILNEDLFLRKREAEVYVTDVGLAHQIGLYRMECGHFHGDHIQRFWQISCLVSFSGSIQPGKAKSAEPALDTPPVHGDGGSRNTAAEPEVCDAGHGIGAPGIEITPAELEVGTPNPELGRSDEYMGEDSDAECEEDQEHDDEEAGVEEDEQLAAAFYAVVLLSEDKNWLYYYHSSHYFFSR